MVTSKPMTDRSRNKTLLVAALSLLVACGKPTPETGEDPEAAERRRDVLTDLAQNVVMPAYADFATRASELRDAIDAWAESGDPADLTAAREAWKQAMLTWQVAELYQFGPAGAMGTTPGGQDLRDQIYSWPTRNPCRVDQELVEQAYTDAEAFREEPVNVRGLDALEYLLHHEEPTNQCDPARSINADGSWDGLDEAEIAARRAAYARTLGEDLVTSADALVNAWEEGFQGELANAGDSSETYPTTHEALNSVSDAMFYVEADVKDMKLGEPAGLLNCASDTCPEAREFVWTSLNFEAVDANLDGFERLYTGGDQLGFDDLLRDAGQDALADEMATKLDEARAQVGATEVSMSEALADDPTPVLEAHTKVKSLTDLLKTQFVGVLDLELPQRAEGDND
jgi:predicted lipoprotein